jgi:hypothetical protein
MFTVGPMSSSGARIGFGIGFKKAASVTHEAIAKAPHPSGAGGNFCKSFFISGHSLGNCSFQVKKTAKGRTVRFLNNYNGAAGQAEAHVFFSLKMQTIRRQ